MSKRYKSGLGARLALITAMGAMNVAKITASPIPNYSGNNNIKKINIATSILQTASNVFKAMKDEKQIRFNKTKRYIK